MATRFEGRLVLPGITLLLLLGVGPLAASIPLRGSSVLGESVPTSARGDERLVEDSKGGGATEASYDRTREGNGEAVGPGQGGGGESTEPMPRSPRVDRNHSIEPTARRAPSLVADEISVS